MSRSKSVQGAFSRQRSRFPARRLASCWVLGCWSTVASCHWFPCARQPHLVFMELLRRCITIMAMAHPPRWHNPRLTLLANLAISFGKRSFHQKNASAVGRRRGCCCCCLDYRQFVTLSVVRLPDCRGGSKSLGTGAHHQQQKWQYHTITACNMQYATCKIQAIQAHTCVSNGRQIRQKFLFYLL